MFVHRKRCVALYQKCDRQETLFKIYALRTQMIRDKNYKRI